MDYTFSVFLLGIVVIAIVGIVSGARQEEASRLTKVFIITLSLSFTFLIAELAAASLTCQSDSFGFTLSAKCWNKKHWKPINQQGYRDKEWDLKEFESKKLILITGDSFVAATGIKEITDRFAGVLQTLLGDEYKVLILAKRGWGPVQQTNALADFQHQAHTIVNSYYFNDIQDALPFCGREMSIDVPSPPVIGARLIQNSYLVNYFFWGVYRQQANPLVKHYLQGVLEALKDPKCLAEHKRQLTELINKSKKKTLNSIAVLFPTPYDMKTSKSNLAKIEQLFVSQGVTTINLEKKINQWPLEDLVVNKLDGHPSEKLHRYVAELLAKEIARK